MVLAARIVKDEEMVMGGVVCGRVDRARLPFSASRRRAPILDLESLGRVPGRRFFNDEIAPASTSGNYCGSLKPSCDGASPDLGSDGRF
jgi:hypothetical protein